jgi:hypothetical protein
MWPDARPPLALIPQPLLNSKPSSPSSSHLRHLLLHRLRGPASGLRLGSTTPWLACPPGIPSRWPLRSARRRYSSPCPTSGTSTQVLLPTGHLPAISHFSFPRYPTPSSIVVGDGSLLPVFGTGSTKLPHSLFLNNILVSPQIIKNLISVRQFTIDNNCSVEFITLLVVL